MIRNTNMKRIVLLTHTHLSRNPRLVKEIDALQGDYELHVIYFHYFKDFRVFDEEIENKYPSVHFHAFKWTSKYGAERVAATVSSKILSGLRRFNINVYPEQIMYPGYFSMLRMARSIKADLYHGHNPAALAVAVNAAKKNGALTTFDAEDFHRGEYREPTKEKTLLTNLEDRYIPQLNLLLTSSPLIEKAYAQLYPGTNMQCILNAFPKKINGEQLKASGPALSMVWFSQVVGKDRGLQDIFRGMDKISSPGLHLSIIGEVSEQNRKYFEALLAPGSAHTIAFRGVISPDALEEEIGRHDIGIASETGSTVNRQYCLTNKLFSYLQCGLALLLSDTQAQKEFYEAHASIGFMYKINDADSVCRQLEKWLQDPALLARQKAAARCLGETSLNWENEKEKLTRTLDQLFAGCL